MQNNYPFTGSNVFKYNLKKNSTKFSNTVKGLMLFIFGNKKHEIIWWTTAFVITKYLAFPFWIIAMPSSMSICSSCADSPWFPSRSK